MFDAPFVQNWDALHPAMSHFPIVLLLVAPVLVFVALIRSGRRDSILAIAFWFLLAGTASIYLSAATGDAAKEVAPKTPEVQKAIGEHEDVGSAARAIFTGLAVLLAALRYGPMLLKKQLRQRTSSILCACYLLVYLVALVVLFNAAHTGALLVHKLGVHAAIR